MILPTSLNGATQSGTSSGGGTGVDLSDAAVTKIWSALQSANMTPGTMGDRFNDIEELITGRATVTQEAGGSRLITFFAPDGTTIRKRVRVSANGLERTVVP